MDVIWKTMQEFAGVGAVLYFFPGIFGYEDEFRSFMASQIHWTLPLLIAIFFISAVAKHAEIANQKRQFDEKLKGAPVRQPRARRNK